MIWLILLIGFILRLISLDQSLWLDEAINVLGAKNNSFWGMVTDYAKFDFHPPGYFAILWLWSKSFGFSEVSVRMPSVIFGVTTIFFVYLIGKKLHSKTLGLVAALLTSVNPLHIYYSQEARMYSLATFSVALNYFLFIKLIKSEKINWLYLTLSNLLVLASDYVAYLIFLAQLIYLLAYSKKNLKKWLVPTFFSGLIVCIWLPVFFSQLDIGSAASSDIPIWKEVVGSNGFKPLILTYVKFIIGRISYSDDLVYGALFLPVGLLFLFLIWRALKFSKDTQRILLTWIVVPTLFAFSISFFIPIYSYFRLLFVLPAFILLITYGIISFKKLKILVTTVLLVQIISSFIYLFNPLFQREDWKGLIDFIKTVPANSKILFESNGSFAPFEYYRGEGIQGVGSLKNFPAKTQLDLIDLRATLNGSFNIYLVDYLVDISDPQRIVSKKLAELGYKQTEVKNFNGVGFVYHYTK